MFVERCDWDRSCLGEGNPHTWGGQAALGRTTAGGETDAEASAEHHWCGTWGPQLLSWL